jgi:hypothetical protein
LGSRGRNPYKLSALAIAKDLQLDPGETVERRAARLEKAFRLLLVAITARQHAYR